MSDYRYCPRCAAELELQPSPEPDPPRLTCPECNFVHYPNPAPTVQAWIDRDGTFLALERNQEPRRGFWNLPGGFVEPGESGPEAIAREVGEETGLEVEVGAVLGIFASLYGDGPEAKPILDIAYRCRERGGTFEISAESGGARWFSLAEFPEPAFSGEQQALAELRAQAQR